MPCISKVLYSIVFIVVFLPLSGVSAEPFDRWLVELRQDAREEGISPAVVEKALSDLHPIPRIIELDRKQPEGRLTFRKYREGIVSKARVKKGRALYRKYRKILESVSREYGIPAQYIVALWGIETNYGANTGGFGVIPALATLAHDGRRSAFFRKELLSALKILDEGHINLENMKGSWAGAMGQNQFMPSSFQEHAVDYNKDGRRDIWTSLPDIFASSAAYLRTNGWKEGWRWGRAVKIPENFSTKDTGLETKRPLEKWKESGVTLPGGGPLPVVQGVEASLILPDGVGGEAFLVYDNYRVIMRWNKSVYFAASVGLLADRIAS